MVGCCVGVLLFTSFEILVVALVIEAVGELIVVSVVKAEASVVTRVKGALCA